MVSCGGLAQAPTKAAGFTYAIAAQPDAYGLYSVTIRNTSKMAITAIHAFRSCNSDPQYQESASTGSDLLMQFSFLSTRFITLNPPALIAPSQTLEMDMPALDQQCPKGVSVLFSDGHGEGDDDPQYGWRRMIADRYSTYAELLRCRGVVEAMDGSAQHFSETLLQTLDARRLSLADRHVRDVPASEARSRSDVVEILLTNLREPDRIPGDLTSKDSTLKLLDRWMQPLKKNGYDKAAA